MVFNPSETRLSIPNQQQLKTKGDEALVGLMAAESDCDNSVSARTSAFNSLDGLVTRVINALRISDVSDQTIEQAESIVRELRNKRASDNVPPAEPAEGIEKEGARRQNKMHSGSFNTKIENFSKLIILLSTIPAYKPNETDLTIASLRAKLEALKLFNTSCATKYAATNAARLHRDIVLYADRTGLVYIASDVKLYVKSAYGATSPQYKSISGLAFRNSTKKFKTATSNPGTSGSNPATSDRNLLSESSHLDTAGSHLTTSNRNLLSESSHLDTAGSHLATSNRNLLSGSSHLATAGSNN